MAIVTLDDQKSHLGVTLDTDDAMITQQIAAAEAHLEQLLGYTFLSEFPDIEDEEEDVYFPDTVPADLVGAVKQFAAHLYENREATVVGINAAELPLGFWDIVRERRNYSF